MVSWKKQEMRRKGGRADGHLQETAAKTGGDSLVAGAVLLLAALLSKKE